MSRRARVRPWSLPCGCAGGCCRRPDRRGRRGARGRRRCGGRSRRAPRTARSRRGRVGTRRPRRPRHVRSRSRPARSRPACVARTSKGCPRRPPRSGTGPEGRRGCPPSRGAPPPRPPQPSRRWRGWSPPRRRGAPARCTWRAPGRAPAPRAAVLHPTRGAPARAPPGHRRACTRRKPGATPISRIRFSSVIRTAALCPAAGPVPPSPVAIRSPSCSRVRPVTSRRTSTRISASLLAVVTSVLWSVPSVFTRFLPGRCGERSKPDRAEAGSGQRLSQ